MNLYRAWLYFRFGHGGYLSLAIALVQFLLVGALYLQRIPGLAQIHLGELAAIFIVPYGILAVMIGWLHKRHQMTTDTEIAMLSNPYLFKIMPGKEEKLMIPLSILGLKVQKIWLENSGLMTPELEKDFADLGNLLARLRSGEEVK